MNNVMGRGKPVNGKGHAQRGNVHTTAVTAPAPPLFVMARMLNNSSREREGSAQTEHGQVMVAKRTGNVPPLVRPITSYAFFLLSLRCRRRFRRWLRRCPMFLHPLRRATVKKTDASWSDVSATPLPLSRLLRAGHHTFASTP
jgi:hypothetical protein